MTPMRTLLLPLLLLSLPAALAAGWPDLARPPAATADGAADAAVVVGIEDYVFAQDLPGARKNALAWVSYLQSRKVPLVKPLLDHQATREELLTAVKQVASQVKPGGTFWLVYIGHGAPSRTEDDGLLVGVDAQQTASSLEVRGLPQRELVAVIEASMPAGAKAVLVLDACFSGKTATGDLAPGLAPLKPVSARVNSSRITALTAAKSDEYAGALPDGSRPAFSYLVLGALRGWGDANGDGKVTAAEAQSYAHMSLVQTVTGRSQTPTLSGEDRVLARGKERGPDLVALAVAAPRASVGDARIDLGGGSTDFATLAAQAQAADAAKRQAEAAAAAATAALAKEERKQLDAAAAKVRTQASADFAKLAGLLATPSESAKPVLESYIAKYGAAMVTVGSRTEGVEVPEVAKVQAALAALGGTSAKAGERVVTKSGIAMRLIPAGSFTMGCTKSVGECGEFTKQPRTVRLTRSLLLGETEVKQGQWKVLMGRNPSHFSTCGLDCPVERVSWMDAVTFANRQSETEGLETCYLISGETVTWPKGLSCTGYRMPTEAEWEYAARAGGDTAYAGHGELGRVAWYAENSNGKTHPVGGKAANAWGLHDMSGNVWEWTWDRPGAYSSGAVADPTGSPTGAGRVCRGGSWQNSSSRALLSDFGAVFSPEESLKHLGLRLARTVP